MALRSVIHRQQFTFSVENQQQEAKITLQDELAARITNTAEVALKEKQELEAEKARQFQEKTRRITDIRQLYSFTETNRVNSLNLQQNLKVLQLINQCSPQYKESTKKIQDALNSTQFEIISRIKQDLMQLEPKDQVTFLNNVAYSNIGAKTKIERDDLQQIEQAIVEKYEDYITTDVANLASSFIRMQVVPSDLIEKILSKDYYTILQNNGSYVLLRQMIMSGVTGQQKLYQMLWENMRTGQLQNLSLSRCIEYIQFVINYQKMIPATHEENVENLQLLLNSFAYTAKNERQIDSYASIMKTIKLVKGYIRSTTEIPGNIVHRLESSAFFSEATRLVFRRIDKLSPGEMTELLGDLDGDSAAKKSLVSDILVSMRVDRYDIRSFNFAQLTQFIALVAETHPGDLKIFVKYLDAAIIQKFYDDEALKKYLDEYIGVLWTFGFNGFVDESPKMIKFIQILTKLLRGDNQTLPQTVHKNLINLLWILIQRETLLSNSGSLPAASRNPLIPRLLTHLYNYKPRRKLTKQEYLQLFQINIWIQEKCGTQVYPEELINCIPPHQAQTASRIFEEYDQPRFPEVQEDIARHLLKMRISFSENVRMDDKYRADISFHKTSAVIILEKKGLLGVEDSQPGQIQGLEMMRNNWISDATGVRVNNINVNHWQDLSTDQKLLKLHNIYSGNNEDENELSDEEL